MCPNRWWRRKCVLTEGRAGGEGGVARCSFMSDPLHPQIKQSQDEEKKQLTALRELIKDSLQLEQKEVGHPWTPPNTQVYPRIPPNTQVYPRTPPNTQVDPRIPPNTQVYPRTH